MQSESLQSLLAALREHTPLAAIPALPALHRGDVIAIEGPAASGKTQLLHHVLVALLAPAAHAEIAAVVYDTDASFDIQRLRRLLRARMPSTDPRECLARVHVFRPTSLAHLAASIAHLPAYHASHMPNQDIAVLAVDSISPFYWADRFAAEQLRDTQRAPPLHHVLHAIQSVRRSHAPLTILTSWGLHSPLQDAIAHLGAKAAGDTDHPPSSPFRLAHHIALSSPPSDPSPTAPLDDPRHPSGTVCCSMRSSGSRDTVRFAFQITDDDVLVQPQQLTDPIS